MICYTDVKVNGASNKDCCLVSPPIPTPTKCLKQEQTVQEKPKNFNVLLKAYWQKYCEKSTIHGVRYIYDPTLRGIERFIWTALVITCVTLTCTSYLILSERYSAKKIQTVVANSQYPVFQIPFPAVAVCTQNRINWEKFELAKATFLPPSANKADVKVFSDFVKRMETLRFGYFDAFNDLDDINLELLESIDVTKLAEFMTIKCEDIFENGTCFWRKMPFDCCSRFVLENTEYGYCLVFNSQLSAESVLIRTHLIITSDSFASTLLVSQIHIFVFRGLSGLCFLVENLGRQFYPYHNSAAGEFSGLNFRLKIESKFKRSVTKADNAVTVLIKRPEQLSNTGYTITPKTATFFLVRAQITTSDADLHALDPLKRNCYFDDETHLLHYKTNLTNYCMLRNCLNKCHEEYMLRYCNCTLPLFFLFADDTAEKCSPSKFRCLAKNNDIFSHDKRKEEDTYFSSVQPGMTCSCLIPCNAVEYFTSLTTLPLYEETNNDTDVDIYNVDVHYQTDVLIQYRTSLEFTVIDLIANFGGIFGLYLGASLVSAVELLVYATFGFGLYLYHNNYFTIFKWNLKNVTQKWTLYLKNCFRENNREDNAIEASFQLKHHPLHKQNRW